MSNFSPSQAPVQFKAQPVSEKIQTEISHYLQSWKEKKWTMPKLVVLLVGADPASQIYVGHKEKMCKALGFSSEVIHLPATISQIELCQKIQKLNADSSVDAVLVQLPLPVHMNVRQVLETIDPDKDADCLTERNLGRLLTNEAYVQPCTPAGIVQILKHYNVSLVGKKIAVIGRSLIVGTPLFYLLNKENATVTLYHSKSVNVEADLKNYDIVCVAIGKAQHFDKSLFKKEAIVIDVGIHRTREGLTGDVDFTNLLNEVYAYTPVPGGVGPMTVIMLMMNTYKLALRHRQNLTKKSL